MPRTKKTSRYIFNTLTVVSLLFILATVVLTVAGLTNETVKQFYSYHLPYVRYYWYIWGIHIPHWSLSLVVAILFAILPAICLFKWNKHRKLLAMVGKCPSCGYDLTGNETGVCPEYETRMKLSGYPLHPAYAYLLR